MKYSQTIGWILCLLLVATCYLPWSYIPSINAHIYGMDSGGTAIGKPGLLHIILCVPMIVFFLVPKVWCKSINVFIAGLNVGWAIRNYVVISTCQGGECPQVFAGVYIAGFLSFCILVMSFLPKVRVPVSDM